jgi:hypothetical protein
MKTVVGQFKLEESPKEDSEEVTKKLMKIKLRLPPIASVLGRPDSGND